MMMMAMTTMAMAMLTAATAATTAGARVCDGDDDCARDCVTAAAPRGSVMWWLCDVVVYLLRRVAVGVFLFASLPSKPPPRLF